MASGTSTAASVLDSRTGRMRARVTLGVDWLVVNALAPVDPLARVLRGSPRTDVYAHYDRIRARGDLVPSRLGLRPVVSRSQAEAILRDPRFGVQPATAETAPADRAGVPAQTDPELHSGGRPGAGRDLGPAGRA